MVEDEALIALDLERRLARMGYEVVGVADNCEDAIKLFLEGHPDLILMDISIRGSVDGIETARAIARLGDVPIVFLTAFADDQTIQRVTDTSPYGYLLKPFDERALTATIKVALERYAADTHLRVLEAAVSTASIGILLVDAHDDQRRISFVNDAFVALSGAPREMIIGKNPCFLSSDPSEESIRRLHNALENRLPARETVYARRLTGEPFWSSVTISPVKNRTGQTTHLLLFHMDISQEREAQQALVESQRIEMVGRLTAGIAHDFNNVLGAIMAFADMARKNVQDEATRNDLDEVVQAAKRGALLTRKLLDFSRHDEAAPTVTADLSRVIREIRQMAEHLAGPGVSIELRIDPEPMFVPLDATSLEQILLNLVSNARDAMPGGGKIAIAVTRPADLSGAFAGRGSVRLEVTDGGTGMTDEIAGQIFRPFFTTKPRGLGTGLGLSTCRMLVERAGGTIRVRTAPGAGATFVLDFPLAEGVLTQDALDTNERADGDAGGATCLLVEDDGALRRSGVRALTDFGFTVVDAANGEIACRKIDTLGSDLRLLICDLVLPGITGAEVVAYARKVCPQAEIIVISGYLDPSVEAFGAGISLLWKPFTTSALTRRAVDALRIGATNDQEAPAEATATARPVTGAAPQAWQGLATAPAQQNPCVLLIEDDDALRRALATVLRAQSLRIIEADTAAGGLAALAAEEIHLALVDINLPDANGLELLTALRKHDSILPILVMTGNPSLENAQHAMRSRATAFLTKPILPHVLIEEVERAMSEGQVARLQHKLLMSKANSGSMLSDIIATERAFNESVSGLYMVFQPIVRAYDRSVFAHEALMRSRGPHFNPGEFLMAAETLDRVTELGRAVRRSIASTLTEHRDRFEPIFVNLHPMEFRTDILMHKDEPLLPFASRIILEVTERAQLSSSQDFAETLRTLRTAGYRVALDDLGEGYAGLSWLVKLTPDIAKLDMSLIRDIQRSRMKRELVGSLISVCRRARTLVVAEGVETIAEADVLRDLGCDLLQGYHFARPNLPFPKVTEANQPLPPTQRA